jgi:hypothetical protein
MNYGKQLHPSSIFPDEAKAYPSGTLLRDKEKSFVILILGASCIKHFESLMRNPNKLECFSLEKSSRLV